MLNPFTTASRYPSTAEASGRRSLWRLTARESTNGGIFVTIFAPITCHEDAETTVRAGFRCSDAYSRDRHQLRPREGESASEEAYEQREYAGGPRSCNPFV